MMPPAGPACSVREMLDHLGAGGTSGDTRELVARIYRGWCARVPYDNARIRRHLVTGDGLLTGRAPGQLWSSAVHHGLGGQCTETARALRALLSAVDVPTSVMIGEFGSASALPVVNHCVVLAHPDEGPPLLVDTALLSGRPLPLVDGARHRIGLAEYRVRRVGTSWEVRSVSPVSRRPVVARLLTTVPDDSAFEAILRGIQVGGLVDRANRRLFIRAQHGERTVLFSGSTLYRTGPEGVRRTRAPRGQRPALLRTAFGLSRETVIGLLPELNIG